MFRVFQRSAILGLLSVSIGTLATEQGPAERLLEKMFHASSTVNYSGLVTYEKASRIKTAEILHLTNGDFSFRKINHLDGPKGQYSKLLPANNCAPLIPYGDDRNALSILSKDSIKQIKNSYHFDIIRPIGNVSQRVAGRDVTTVIIRPKDRHRLPLKFSIDDQSGVVLKSELFNLEGRALERFQFIKLTVGGELDLLQIPDNKHQNEVNCNLVFDRAVIDSWSFGWMPSNFLIRKAERSVSSGRDTLVFSDGLAVVTVVIELPKLKSSLPELELNYGGASVVSIKNKSQKKVFNASVVGEIPLATARKIAQSVAYSSDTT